MAELPRTIHDLEQEFAGLAVEIPESPTKRAISRSVPTSHNLTVRS